MGLLKTGIKTMQTLLFPTQNFHESHQQFGQPQISKIWPNHRCLASLDSWPYSEQGREGSPRAAVTIWRVSWVLLVLAIISLNTICRDLSNTSDTSAFLLGTLQLLPAPASQLLRHHSHFLASPVGYLYERGDR